MSAGDWSHGLSNHSNFLMGHVNSMVSVVVLVECKYMHAYTQTHTHTHTHTHMHTHTHTHTHRQCTSESFPSTSLGQKRKKSLLLVPCQQTLVSDTRGHLPEWLVAITGVYVWRDTVLVNLWLRCDDQ